MSGCLANDLKANLLPEEIMEIQIRFAEGGFLFKGKLDGPAFINPKFETLVRIRPVTPNTFDFVLHRMKMAGISFKLFSGIIFRIIEKTLKKTFAKDYIECNYLKTSDKNTALRVKIKPDAFFPLFKNNGQITGITIIGNSLKIFVKIL